MAMKLKKPIVRMKKNEGLIYEQKITKRNDKAQCSKRSKSK